jgi:hypothetical protein
MFPKSLVYMKLLAKNQQFYRRLFEPVLRFFEIFQSNIITDSQIFENGGYVLEPGIWFLESQLSDQI